MIIHPAGFINLTPHPVNMYGTNSIEDGPVFIFQPSGNVARIAQIELGFGVTGSDAGVEYALVEYGQLENPPRRIDGVQYIVSLVTALAVRGRDDFLAPFDEVRNESGTLIGCRRLQRIC